MILIAFSAFIMASVVAQRPATNGVTAAQNVLQRQSSFSSFPTSRSPSLSTRNNKSARSPQPVTVRESAGSPNSSPNHSRRSSLSATRTANQQESNRKIRSQYPSNSPENHVEYILVASFDIDRGSVMEHQYPAPISGDEHMLAELMLPDQAHVRSQDWTIFFLHKDTSAEEEAKEERRERRRRRRRKKDGQEGDDTSAELESQDEGDGDPEEADETDDDFGEEEEESDDDEGIEGPPLIYVLNLVNTKQDNTAKRFVRCHLVSKLYAHVSSQRCGRKGNGNMYKTFFLTYIQGIVSSSPQYGEVMILTSFSLFFS